jgi:hypothetical protein
MRLPRMTTRRWMIGVALLCAVLGLVLTVMRDAQARRYRVKAGVAAWMERRCREIDAMDPVARARAAEEETKDPFRHDPPYFSDPEWNRKMIGFWQEMKDRYSYAADHPWLAVPPDRPNP